MLPSRFPSPLIEPDVRISRIRLSDWFHYEAHGYRLRPTVQRAWARPTNCGVYRLTANHLVSVPSRTPRSKGPSLHRHYPASSVLSPSPSPRRAALLSGSVGGLLHPSGGSPNNPDHLPYMPCSLPRWTRAGARVGGFPAGAAFPVSQAGRRPRLHFRGLLKLHSRYGLDRK